MGTKLDEFKAQVKAKALEIKAEENWCDEGFMRAMSELGIEITDEDLRAKDQLEFDLVVTYKVRGSTDYRSSAETNENWNMSSIMNRLDLNSTFRELASDVRLDSDWRDVEVNFVSMAATQAEPVED